MYGPMKTCTKCKTEQPLDNFYKNKLSKDGFMSRCKYCIKQYNKENVEKKKEYDKQYRKNNRERLSVVSREYQKNNRERLSVISREYQKNNKERLRLISRETQRKRIETDPNFKLERNLRRRLNHVLKDNYKSAPTLKLLGCPVFWLRLSLESKFYDRTDGTKMTFDNYGTHGWHMDHIKPCSSFDLSDPIEQQKCSHWTNLQPLWAEDNLAKSDKIL